MSCQRTLSVFVQSIFSPDFATVLPCSQYFRRKRRPKSQGVMCTLDSSFCKFCANSGLRQPSVKFVPSCKSVHFSQSQSDYNQLKHSIWSEKPPLHGLRCVTSYVHTTMWLALLSPLKRRYNILGECFSVCPTYGHHFSVHFSRKPLLQTVIIRFQFFRAAKFFYRKWRLKTCQRHCPYVNSRPSRGLPPVDGF